MSVDSPKPSGSPDPDRPSNPDAQNEVTDADLWNLEEDLPARPTAQPTPRDSKRKPGAGDLELDLSGASERSVQRGKTRSRSTEKSKEDLFSTAQAPPRPMEDEIGELEDREEFSDDDSEDAVLVVIPEEEEPAPPPAEPKPAKKEVAPETPREESDEPSAEARRNRPKKTAVEQAAASPWFRPSRRDVFAIGGFAFILLLTGIWVISRFSAHLHFQSSVVEMPDYPLKGEHAVISEGETYWREPIREGASRDVARREVAMIPVLELNLDPGKSSDGALRVIFRNSEGEAVGDSITRSFAGGRFDASGDPKIAFPATDGFLEEGTFNGYRTRTGKPWMVEVLEGPSINAPASSFKKLVDIPVLPQRR